MDREEILKPVRYHRALLASGIHGFPASKMKMIGVTGTDGKTTTCNLIYHILKSQGFRVGLVSTIAAKIFDGTREIEIETGFHVTTPDSFEIFSILRKMAQANCNYAVVECTSHALAQERMGSVNFDIGVVTNISHEHLDYHKTLGRYVLAKAQLFRRDKNFFARPHLQSTAIINQDDQAWDLFKPYLHDWDVVGYGYNDFSRYRILDTRESLHGTTFTIVRQSNSGDAESAVTIQSPLVGSYNVSNVAAAFSAVSVCGVSLEDCARALPMFRELPGRFERILSQSHGLIVVDFAHTPNALSQLLSFIRSQTQGRVIVVFGCAGERDTEKRPMMGKIAAQYADLSIITADDPRSERVEDISEQIAYGARENGAELFPHGAMVDLGSESVRQSLFEHTPVYILEPDRKKAIISAIALAGVQDVVVVCGKGHEKTMCFGSEERPWSDQVTVNEALYLLEKRPD